MSLQIIRPDSVRHAVAILAAEGGARFLGGGTLVMRDVNAGDTTIDTLVLSDGLGLDRIDVDVGHVTLGTAVSMAAIARHLAFLAPVAAEIGGPAVRAMASVGGNLFAPYPHGDFSVALLALGAEVTIEDLDGSRTIDLEDFLTVSERATSGIVRDVSFPLPPAGAFRFVKVVRRHPHGASVLSIAAVLPMVDGKVSAAKIAYGAMADTPIRARPVEAAIEGKPLDKATIAAALRVATDGCAPRSDPQASDWYRLNVLPVHLARLLRGE